MTVPLQRGQTNPTEISEALCLGNFSFSSVAQTGGRGGRPIIPAGAFARLLRPKRTFLQRVRVPCSRPRRRFHN